MFVVPEGYDHKATSESFSKQEKVSIYYNRMSNEYLIHIYATQEEDGKTVCVTKQQLELIVHAGRDVLDDA